jgi:hypothetical protein
MDEQNLLLKQKDLLRLSNAEYFERERAIKRKYGKLGPGDDDQWVPPPPAPAQAVPRPMKRRQTNPGFIPAQAPFAVPHGTPPRRPSPSIIDITSSSPLPGNNDLYNPFDLPLPFDANAQFNVPLDAQHPFNAPGFFVTYGANLGNAPMLPHLDGFAPPNA